MNWIDGLTDEQKKACGLMPNQIKERFQKQLAVIMKEAVDCKEKREVVGALKAAINRMK